MKAYRSAEDTPLIEFGVHGAAHIPIGRQEEETEEEFQKKLLEELTKSKETLEGMLNEPLTLLALPFGSGFRKNLFSSMLPRLNTSWSTVGEKTWGISRLIH